MSLVFKKNIYKQRGTSALTAVTGYIFGATYPLKITEGKQATDAAMYGGRHPMKGPVGMNIAYPPIGGGFPGGGLQPTQPTPPAGLSLGYGIPLGSGPSRSLPGLGLGGFGPSTASNAGNTEMAFNANGTIPQHYVMLPSMNNADDRSSISQLGVGMLCFARQMQGAQDVGLLPHGAKYAGGMSTHLDPASGMFLEWSQLQHWLVKYGKHYKTPEQIAAEWKLAGVIKVEVAPNNDGNYGQRSSNRLLGFVVGQRVSTFNIFGLSVMEGTPLYLVIKKEPVDAIFINDVQRPDPDAGSGRKRPRDVFAVTDDRPSRAEVEGYVWKVIPYADRQCHKPGLAAMSYFDLDDHGNVIRKVGKLLYVGMASSAAPPSHLYGATKIGLANSNERITLFKRGMLPNVEIYLGV